MQKLDIFACENNMLSSHVKISLLLWLHNKSCLSHQKTNKVKWFGISLVFIQYTEHHMAAWRYEISLLVLKKYFSTLEEEFGVSRSHVISSL